MSQNSSRLKRSSLKTSSREKIELDRNLGTDPFQIQEILMRSDFPNPITEDVDEFGKFVAEMSYIQSRMHSDCDSAESISDSDLEDGELRKMYAKSRGL